MGDIIKAIELYIWNLKVSSAFVPALALTEIAIRNAFDRELRTLFGANWFEEKSLVEQLSEYWKAKLARIISEERKRRRRDITSGDIVAELNFAFWVQLSTPKAARSIWKNAFPPVFPAAPAGLSAPHLHAKLERMRVLRNRIAHHEPIFNRHLAAEHDNIRELLLWRCSSTCELLDAISILHQEIAACPVPRVHLLKPSKASP
ncbi:MAG: hypothetical protein ACRC7G_16970 [Beijerinckiaceae bacterium]